MFNKLIFIAHLLILTTLTQAKNSPYCMHSFLEVEEQFENQLNVPIMEELGNIFQKEDQYLLQLFQGFINDIKPMHLLHRTAIKKTIDLGSFSIYLLGTLFFSALAYCFLIRFLTTYKFHNILQKMGPQNSYVKKAAVVLLIIVCVLIMISSYRFLNEVENQSKTLNHIMCRFLQGPKGFVNKESAEVVQGFEALYNYLDQAMKKHYHNFTVPLSETYLQLGNAKYFMQTLEFILTALPESESGFMEDVKWRRYELEVANRYSSKQSVDHCQYSVFSVIEEMLGMVESLKIFTDTIQNDLIEEFSFPVFVKIFFQAIIGFVVIVALFVCSRKQPLKSNNLVILQFSIATVSLICGAVFLTMPFFLSHLYWTHNGVSHTTQNELRLREFAKITFPKDEGYNQPARELMLSFQQKSFLELKATDCIRDLEYFNGLLKYYSDKDDNFFLNLFETAKGKITDQSKKDNLAKLVDRYPIRRPIVSSIQLVHRNQEFFLQQFREGGDLWALNMSSLGVYFREVSKMACTLLINRVYKGRQICGNLSLLFFLLLILTYLFPRNWSIRQWKQKIMDKENTTWLELPKSKDIIENGSSSPI